MSQAKHKSYRSVLKVERKSYDLNGNAVLLTLVYWAIVERKTSRSVYSCHYAVTIYAGSKKHSGITACMPRKAERVDYSDMRLSEAFTHALYSYLGGKTYAGKIRWFDKSSGCGSIDCPETGLTHHFYSCNVKGANSAHEQLVTNVDFDRGDEVKFQIHVDPYVSLHCGATHIEKAVA